MQSYFGGNFVQKGWECDSQDLWQRLHRVKIHILSHFHWYLLQILQISIGYDNAELMVKFTV